MKKSSLVIAAAIALVAGMPSSAARVVPRRRPSPTPSRGKTMEHIAWNAEVDRRKAEKKARKVWK